MFHFFSNLAVLFNLNLKIMANLLNPYAYTGDLHNQGLDFIAQNLLSFDRVPTGSKVLINLSATFVNNSGFFPEATFSNLIEAGTLAYNNILLDRFPSDFTEQQITYAKQVENVFDGYENPFRHISEINNKIDDIVEKVFTSGLSEQEQIPLLIGLAVGKSSLYYWNQQASDSNSYWSQINDKQSSQQTALRIDWPTIDWGAVLKADARGAIRGFFKGLFGGGGGAIGGAVSGALGASAGNLALQIYDYYFG